MSSAPRPATQGSRPSGSLVGHRRGRRPLHELRRRAGLPSGEPELRDALAGRETWGSFQLDGSTFRTYTGPLVEEDKIIAAVQVGRSESSTDGVLGYVRLAGAAAMLIGLALAWFGGYFIAAWHSRPWSAFGGARRPSMLRGCLDVWAPLPNGWLAL